MSPQDTPLFLKSPGQDIFYRHWKTSGRTKGILVVIHGFNAHSGYFQDFAASLNAAEFDVYAPDLPGRGRSDGERFYIDDYNSIVQVIDKLVDLVSENNPRLPVFIYGHSAGGVFASVYAAQYCQKINGLISASFAFSLPAPSFAVSFLSFLGSIIPHTRVLRLSNNHFSRDPAVVARMDNDPLIAGEKQPARTIRELVRASAELKKLMPGLRLPLFIIHGTADKATVPAGSQYFMDHAGSADKELKFYEGHYHDLLNDTGKSVVVNDVTGWLNRHV